MIKLSHFINEAPHPAAVGNNAASQAKQRGLTSAGWGRWKDKSGKVVAKTVDGKLVNVDQSKRSATSSPAAKKSARPATKTKYTAHSEKPSAKSFADPKAGDEAIRIAQSIDSAADRYYKTYIKAYPNDNEFINMIEKDIYDLQRVADLVHKQEWKRAANAMRNLDTNVRDTIPSKAYDYIFKTAYPNRWI